MYLLNSICWLFGFFSLLGLLSIDQSLKWVLIIIFPFTPQIICKYIDIHTHIIHTHISVGCIEIHCLTLLCQALWAQPHRTSEMLKNPGEVTQVIITEIRNRVLTKPSITPSYCFLKILLCTSVKCLAKLLPGIATLVSIWFGQVACRDLKLAPASHATTCPR